MLFYDEIMLIQNINELMKKNSDTQQQLAEILGMSQSNVSKALNPNNKKTFTLDQVIGIAQHYKVSIDKLVGNHNAPSYEYSPRAVAAMLAKMIEEGDAEYFTIDKSEIVYNNITCGSSPDFCVETREVEYPAIYLRSYWDVPSHATNIHDEMLISAAKRDGNGTPMRPVNTFLKQFKEIHSIYNHFGLSRETYDIVVTDLLTHLEDSSTHLPFTGKEFG